MTKLAIAALTLAAISLPAWAYPTGTYNCTDSTNSTLSATWKISTFNANLPYVDVTYTSGGQTTEVQGIGTIETLTSTTLIGVSTLDDSGTLVIEFNSDGTVHTG